MQAAEGGVGREEGRLALLREKGLDDAVAAGTALQPAVTRAAVEVPRIAVIAFFVPFHSAIAAAGGDGEGDFSEDNRSNRPFSRAQGRLHRGGGS